MPVTLPELLYSAKDRVSTLTTTIRIQYDVRRGTLAWQAERARLEPDRVAANASRSLTADALDPSDINITELRIWVSGRNHLRMESARRIAGTLYETSTVVNPKSWWIFRPPFGVETSDVLPASKPPFDLHSLGPERFLLDPAPIVGLVEFSSVVRADRDGRPMLRAEATPRMLLGSPTGAIWDGAEQYRFDIDAANGFPWRMATIAQGEQFASLEVLDAAFDEPLSDELFSFVPSPEMDVFPPGGGGRLRPVLGPILGLKPNPSP